MSVSSTGGHLHEVPPDTKLDRHVLMIAGDRRITQMVGRDLAVEADATLLAQALNNLVGNAARYCPRGGWIEVSAHRYPGGIEVVIANACLPGEGPQGHSAMHATAAAYHDADESVPPDCAQFCNEDLPLVAKLKTVHDQSAVQPLLVALFEVPVVAERSLRVDPALLAHPPPGVPVYLRSLRLAL